MHSSSQAARLPEKHSSETHEPNLAQGARSQRMLPALGKISLLGAEQKLNCRSEIERQEEGRSPAALALLPRA